MRYNLLFFVMVGLLFSLGAPVGRAQDEPPKVLDASEEVQRTFLRRYLLLFAPEAFPALNLGEVEPPPVVFEGMGGKDPYDVGRILVNRHDWAVDMVVERIKEIPPDTTKGKLAVSAVLEFLFYAGRADYFSIVSSRLKENPEYERWIRQTLHWSFAHPSRGTARIWYQMAESTDPVVRKVAGEELGRVLEYPSGPQWWEMAEGFLDRYGHPPTPFELGTDPLFRLSSARFPDRVAEVRAQVVRSTESVSERRRLTPPSVVRK
jgi:hypothetical protein